MKNKKMPVNKSVTNNGLTRLTFRVATINWRRNDLWKIALYFALAGFIHLFLHANKN